MDFYVGILKPLTYCTLNGLTDEQLLRKRITELQELRRLGITSLAEAETYEKARQYRVSISNTMPPPS
jgi:hypothetical protein